MAKGCAELLQLALVASRRRHGNKGQVLEKATRAAAEERGGRERREDAQRTRRNARPAVLNGGLRLQAQEAPRIC